MSERRRTTLRLPVPTGPDRAHFAYAQLRWLYRATCAAMGDASSGTRQAIQAQASDALLVLLPNEILPSKPQVDCLAMIP